MTVVDIQAFDLDKDCLHCLILNIAHRRIIRHVELGDAGLPAIAASEDIVNLFRAACEVAVVTVNPGATTPEAHADLTAKMVRSLILRTYTIIAEGAGDAASRKPAGFTCH